MISYLKGIEVFLAIAKHSSFSAAARAMGVGVPAVSQRLKLLEQELGVTLLTRTTRALDLTPAGRVLLSGAGPALEQVQASIEKARSAGKAKSGTLRLTIPWSAYKILVAPVLADFHAAYPDIRLELSFDEALVDIVREGFHAGFRLGDRLADGMIATRLTGPLVAAYTASPEYFTAHGRPLHPRDLLSHNCICYRFVSANRIADWPFLIDGQETTMSPPARLVFDSFRSVVEAALGGHGIGWSLRAVVEDAVAEGRLESVLEPFAATHPPFHVFYPEENRQLEPLRLFIAFLKQRRAN